MKNLSKLAMLVMAASLLITGCQKDLSTPDSIARSVSNDATTPNLNQCKIRRIYQNGATALFSYNNAGNPYSLLYSSGGTGVHDHYFIYNSQNRLTEWRLTFGDFIQQHHFYKYNANNLILKDSLIQYNPGNAEINTVNVSTIEYDPMGRVVKETIVNTYNVNGTLNPTRRPTFTYDSRGNLAVAGWKSSSYDNKINPLRQNGVFQFIMRNYSMNNAAVQPKYNSIGLPLSMKPTNDNFFNGAETTKVIYDCQ